MKIRSGFVSNSSTASFIISNFGTDDPFDNDLSEDTIKKLKVFCSAIGAFYDRAEDEIRVSVICNEDEPINYFIENRISFKAETQYDQDFVAYSAKEDIILTAQNDPSYLKMPGKILLNTAKKKEEIMVQSPLSWQQEHGYKEYGN